MRKIELRDSIEGDPYYTGEIEAESAPTCIIWCGLAFIWEKEDINDQREDIDIYVEVDVLSLDKNKSENETQVNPSSSEK